jgi:hypothetical protein
MTCCGKKRLAPNSATTVGPNALPRELTTHSPSGPSAGTVSRAAQFEYHGGRILTVIGQGTGYQYRFVGYGARLSVDARDRASLADVPGLREIRS